MSDTSNAKLQDLWTDSPTYQRCYQSDDELESVLALLELNDACRLVDVGCGNGVFALAAAARYPACRVWAFDALDSAAGECRARAADLPRSNFSAGVAWAHSIPLNDAVADRALMRSVLHHVADPSSVYRELAPLLKPGGRLVLQTPCNYWEPEFAEVLSELMMLMDDTHRRYFYRPGQVVAGLEQAGFHVSEPQCWPFEFPFLDARQAELVRRHGAEKRLRLHKIESGKWCIDNYWVRVTATRSP